MADIGEDWESECYDEHDDESSAAGQSAPSVNINDAAAAASLLNDLSVEAVERRDALLGDVPVVSECDDVLWNDVSSSSAVITEHCRDGDSSGGDGSYVSDSKKVFVSNVNYRVGSVLVYYILEAACCTGNG